MQTVFMAETLTNNEYDEDGVIEANLMRKIVRK